LNTSIRWRATGFRAAGVTTFLTAHLSWLRLLTICQPITFWVCCFLLQTGAKVNDICREMGISSGKFHNWRSNYAGQEVNEAKRLKELYAA